MLSTHQPTREVSEEEKGFLANSSSTDDTYQESGHGRPPWPLASWISTPSLVLHTILVLIYTAAFFQISIQKGIHGPDLVYTPAREAIHFKSQVFEVKPDISESSAWLYAGPPRAELDEAWDNLLKYADIRISEQEMSKLGRQTEGVRFTDGSGYFGQLAVHHNLHCLRRLHHFLNLNYYFPNLTETEYKLLEIHNIHCLDTLRQAIMCHGDATPLTMRWDTTQPLPIANWTSPHECVDWNTLNSWSENRHVDVLLPGLVVHPTLGPAYTKPNRVGVVQ